MLLKNLLWFLVTLSFSLTGQAFLKKGVAQALDGQSPSAAEFAARLWTILLSPWVIAGVALCGAGVLSWMFILSRMDLSRALPMLGGMAYIAIFAVGKLFLKEEVYWPQFAGILLIIGGLFLLSMKPAA